MSKEIFETKQPLPEPAEGNMKQKLISNPRTVVERSRNHRVLPELVEENLKNLLQWWFRQAQPPNVA